MDLDEYSTQIYDNVAEFKSVVKSDKRFVAIHPDSISHVCFTLATDSQCDLHKIVSVLRKDNIFLEYYIDYIRIVVVNPNLKVSQFKVVLDKIYEAFSNLNNQCWSSE